MTSETGKWIMVAGGGVVFIGIIVYFFHDKLNWLGRLPGDIRVERDNFKFFFPITTMILLSLLVSGILWLIRRL